MTCPTCTDLAAAIAEQAEALCSLARADRMWVRATEDDLRSSVEDLISHRRAHRSFVVCDRGHQTYPGGGCVRCEREDDADLEAERADNAVKAARYFARTGAEL